MKKKSHPTVIVIGGPTASGKSALAAAMAADRNGVIINADVMQLYGAFPILSASPQTKDPNYRLYGILPPDKATNAAGWVRLAIAEIETAFAQNKQPIIVGGTGLYLEALVKGIAAIPNIPIEIRQEVQADIAKAGVEAVYRKLVSTDPLSAHLKPGDTQRVGRAWEVYKATGRSLFAWQADSMDHPKLYDYSCIAILPPREDLYRACDTRFMEMMDRGAVEEVEKFLSLHGLSLPAARTLGVKQIAALLQGSLHYKDAVRLAQTATRQYAKRQVTWFRNRFSLMENNTIIISNYREQIEI